MKIKILRVDIALGLPRSSHDCPIALACNRHFAEDDITVGPTSLFIKDTKYKLDKIGQKFVEDFDNDLPVSLCEVEITI